MIYDKATLVQIPSGYKGGTLYSVVPNTADGDFDVTRGSTATRVNKDGLIETVASGVPRLDYPLLDGVVQDCPALLLEPSRTNNILQSNDPSGANWTDPLSRWTLLSNTTTAPDGGTVRIIELTESGGSLIRLTGLSIAAGTYTVSFYIKDIDGNLTGGNVDIGDEGSGVPSPAFGDVGSDWVRATRTITTTATKSHMDLQPTFSGSTNKVAIWGVQLEAGSYPTSYIPTTTAATRTADTCQKTSVASGLINQTEGVIFLDFENYGQIGTSYSGYFKIQSDGNDDRVTIQGDGSTLNRLILVVNDGSSTFFQPRTIIPLGRNKVAIRYKSGLVASFINGAKIDTSSTSFSFSNTLNTIQLQQPNKVHQAMVFNEALTDSELQTLTS